MTLVRAGMRNIKMLTLVIGLTYGWLIRANGQQDGMMSKSNSMIASSEKKCPNLRFLFMVFLLVLTLYIDCFANSDSVTSTSNVNQSLSPSRNLFLVNLDSQDKDHAQHLGGNHALFLINISTLQVRKILVYGRHIAVLWSPIDDMLAITDYTDSNESNCLVFLEGGRKKFDLMELLAKSKKDQVLHYDHFDHFYIEAVKWESVGTLVGTLVFKVSGYGGYGSPKEFESYYVFYPTEKKIQAFKDAQSIHPKEFIMIKE